MSQALANKVEDMPLAPAASESAAILSVIERMAVNPDIDPDRIERFIALKERMEATAARKAFAAALSELQAAMPVIEERGRIEVRKKTASGERDGDIQQSTSYALWEDINEAIKPMLKEHGFALSFRTGQTPEGKITVTGILSHREGHQEDTTMILQHDSTGSKNAVQAIGSSVSYGKRYTAAALLNITSRGEDDDGQAAGIGPTINEQQRQTLDKLMGEVGADESKFLGFFGIEYLAELPSGSFVQAKQMLEAKRK